MSFSQPLGNQSGFVQGSNLNLTLACEIDCNTVHFKWRYQSSSRVQNLTCQLQVCLYQPMLFQYRFMFFRIFSISLIQSNMQFTSPQIRAYILQISEMHILLIMQQLSSLKEFMNECVRFPNQFQHISKKRQ